MRGPFCWRVDFKREGRCRLEGLDRRGDVVDVDVIDAAVLAQALEQACGLDAGCGKLGCPGIGSEVSAMSLVAWSPATTMNGERTALA